MTPIPTRDDLAQEIYDESIHGNWDDAVAAANVVHPFFIERDTRIAELETNNDEIRHKLAVVYDNVSRSHISKPSTDPDEVLRIWQDEIMELEASRDDALDALKATQEELTYVKSDQWIEDVVGQVVAERDAALEEIELRALKPVKFYLDQIDDLNKLLAEARRIADQLRNSVNTGRWGHAVLAYEARSWIDGTS